MDDLIQELNLSGVNPDSLVRLDKTPDPRHIRYVDLMSTNQASTEVLPDAVVESSGQPFAYVIRGNRLGDLPQGVQARLAELVRVLACRSDARYLCVVRPGVLDVYPLAIFESAPPPLKLRDKDDRPSWRALLSAGVPLSSSTAQSRANEKWLETLLFQLLVDAARGIQKAAPGFSIQQVIALVGRALFFRFLVDRGIVTESSTSSISSKEQSLVSMFADAASLVDTCRWLDKTFNGDLLSLGDKDYEGLIRLAGKNIGTICWHLTNIQHRSVGGQLPLDWSGIRFRHVPVDVLSQVYEDFAHEFVPDLARATSVHFTPRQLAEVVIDGAFSAVRSCAPHYAKVLDPSAGAGVFLVLAFRRLVAERWRAFGTRPSRTDIRQILMTQLTGFDINRDALNISALSLYLAALELDPAPSPLSELKFEKLIGSVLHVVDVEALGGENADDELGSLSTRVRAIYQKSFDIVVGNPPWTGLKGEAAVALNNCMTGLLADLATPSPGLSKVPDVEFSSESQSISRESEDDAMVPSQLVARYGSPDVAFLLASARWAKPAGALGFALHARLLFQPEAYELRRRVFSAVRVTGIMNFAALRQDKKLWPTNSAPFMLLVAQNEKPVGGESFFFVSPKHEPQLAEMGQFRVDPSAAISIPLRLIGSSVYALKAVFKGGLLGVDLLNRIQKKSSRTVAQQLESANLKFWSGYQLGKELKRTQSAAHLEGLPLATLAMRFSVPKHATPFGLTHVQWPRAREIYRGPLLLFRESPKSDRALRGALYAESDAAYSESFFGLSFHGRKTLKPLVDLLYVLSYSDLFLYYQLLTSPKFGVERDSSLQSDLDAFPLVDIDGVDGNLRKEVAAVAAALRSGEECWNRVDSVMASLYDLSAADEQLIQDTLAMELPFTGTRKGASESVTPVQLQAYTETFNRLVRPFLKGRCEDIAYPSLEQYIDGWAFVEMQSPHSTEDADHDSPVADLKAMASLAGTYWSSQICVRRKDGSQLMGQLSQSRYWTRTQARLRALDWLQHGPLVN
ncbi:MULTISPECIES: class I SAM-dependent DNA methyltransferase [unclassified Burkholderia]|uniref:HsdM family class I SAM-dependent methyltransferase n=1 Tax=unclassified Burkholderia TaxID=2613784 RepID=UPI00159F08F1|nr:MULTISPECIES: N-6 DNA methylase [unclassified Burkholderia]MBR8235741.1 N-6 DNA methylase [Burkholderia sp. AU32357]MBY4878117.1 N-6 DNA methylase [Burkholderia sp. AU42008]